jgi:hypothetical protein
MQGEHPAQKQSITHRREAQSNSSSRLGSVPQTKPTLAIGSTRLSRWNRCELKISKIEQENLQQSAREYPLAQAPSHNGKSEQIKQISGKGINYQLQSDTSTKLQHQIQGQADSGFHRKIRCTAPKKKQKIQD